jgi:hypothetical protein
MTRIWPATFFREASPSAQLIASDVGDARVFAQLIRSLDDADTAVVEEAAEVLVVRGGVSGLREVLRRMTTADDDIFYYIRDRLATGLTRFRKGGINEHRHLWAKS